VNTAGELGNWSAVRSFRSALLPPTLVSPAESFVSKELRPHFDWGDVAGASGYTLQISKSGSFSPAYLTVSPAVSSFVPTADLPKNTVLFWRVRSRGTNGPSAYSAQRSLTTPLNPPPAPVTLLPASGALSTEYTPTLTWKPVPMPAGTTLQGYIIQVDDHADFSSPVIDEAGVAVPAFTPIVNLAANAKFYWRVRAVNTAGELGNWSVVRSFRSAILPPTLIAPADGSTSVSRSPLFDWSDVPGNGGYTLQIWRAGPTPALVKSVTLAANVSHYQLATKLLANTAYLWKVQTRASNGPSRWMGYFSFSTGS
jgi:hypothetical protein